MTNRAEIERLLNQTGRTLEGLPTQDDYWYSDDYVDRNKEIGMMMYRSGFIRYEPYIMHQSDAIELLVGALRDALDKKPKRKNVKFAPCTCGYNTHSEWYNCENHVWYYECNKCGRKSDKYEAKTKIEARIGWNKMIEELKVGEVHD